MQQGRPHTDALGRVIGMLIFLAGVALLGLVFSIAHKLFQTPIAGLGFLASKGTAVPPTANIGAAIAEFAKQLLLLGLMTIVGSLTAGKGIEMYLGASHWGESHRPVKPVEPAAAKPLPATSESTTPVPNAEAKTQGG